MKPINSPCQCRRCLEENDKRDIYGFPIGLALMIVCPQCGNKRCPHATDHRYACTRSNALGQTGSEYQ